MTVAVVVPARNEAAWIAGVLETMPDFVRHVVVVDDGSTDDTASLARAGGAEVLRHEASRGVGAAITSGYRWALQRTDASIVAVMAGDGQMCPDDLAPLLEPILRNQADYTKGNRFAHPDVKHTMPLARRMVGQVLSAATAYAVGLDALSDSQSGYTAASRRALQSIDLDAVWSGYGYPNDLVGHLVRAGMRVQDVPIRPIYRGEASGLRPWHVLTILRLLARARVARMTWPSSNEQRGTA